MGFRTILAFALGLACSAAFAQIARSPAKMLVGFPPGGAVDVLGRIFAESLSESIARPVIVENRPGAVGQIAAEALKAAVPDGSTLMLAPDASIVIRPQTLKRPPFDPLADFAAVAHTGNWALALAINAGLPAKDLREFVAWARANPAGSAFGSSGAGGSTHLYGLMLSQALGVDLRHIPYKGAGPAIADLVAGHVASSVQPLGTFLQQARAGKVRVLGISAGRRSPSAPEVPTFAELGYPSLEAEGWFGIFAPAATSAETISRLNSVFVGAMRTPAVMQRMRNLDLEVREMTAGEFASRVKADYARWGAVIRASGFSGDNQ